MNPENGEVVWLRSRGHLVPDPAGGPGNYMGVTQNVTERKRLESHFLRAQRMESIGTLVGGIAHGPDPGTTVCQLHMRYYKDGEELWIRAVALSLQRHRGTNLVGRDWDGNPKPERPAS